MKSDDGTLSFGAVLDTSNFDEGVQKVMDKIGEVGTFTQEETNRIASILSDVPTLDINVVSNASQTLATIEQAYNEIDRVNDANRAAISQLEAEYNRLGQLASAAYKKATVEGDKEYAELQQKQSVIKSLINERKRVVNAVAEEADKVQQIEQKLQKEAQATQKTSDAHSSLRQQIRALKQEMADLVASGIDEQSEAYKRLVNELGRLTDIQGDISQQGKVLANDEAAVAGVISGLNGLSGAMTAAEGALSLFVGENEDLQKVMTKLQSLMAITMGLQQVQQTLNKDSAFSLKTLNDLKQWWNKLLAIGRGEQIAETAATEANAAAQAANTAATVADTTAQTANNTATAAGTVAQGANTAATAVNTTAAVAGTAANIGLAGAFRMVGAAIKSIPVFGWIAAGIGVLIGVISHFIDKAKEQEKEVEEVSKIEEDARKTYAQSSAEIQHYQERINSFNGTKKQEKQLVEELNQKYGTALGKYDTLSQWKSILTTKGEAYCNMLLKEAEAQAYLNKYTEAFVNLQVVRDKAEAGVYDHWYNTKAGDEKSRQDAINAAQSDVDKWLQRYKAKMKEAEDIKANFNLNPISSNSDKPTKTTTSGGTSNTDTFDYKESARKQRDEIRKMRDEIVKWRKEAQSSIDDAVIDNMAESQAKEINQIVLNTNRKKEEWRNKLLELAKQVKEGYHNVYMAQKGATEDGWEKSKYGKMSDEDYMKSLLGDPRNYKLYYSEIDDITEQGERQIQAVRQKYRDQWVDNYGSTAQKIEALEKKYQETLANAPQEFVPQVIKAFEKQFSELRTSGFKESIDWESVFGDLSKQSLASLQTMLSKIKTYFNQNKADLSTEEIKDYQEAITKMEDEIASRNPFTALHKALLDIKSAKDDFKKSLKEQTDAQNELTEATERYNAAIAERDRVQSKVDVKNTFTRYSKDSVRSLNDMILALESKEIGGTALSSTEQEILDSMRRIKAQIEQNDPFKDLGDSLASLKAKLADGTADETTIRNLSSNLNGVTSVIRQISDVLTQASNDAVASGDTVSTKITDTIGNLQVLIGSVQQGSENITDNSADALKRASNEILSIGTALAQLRENNNGGIVDTEALTTALESLQDFLDEGINESGENADEYTTAVGNATEATNKLNESKEKSNNADRNVINNQNRITQSYKQYATRLRSVGDVISKVGDQAKNLASIFSDDVAANIDKAIDVVTSLLDAASTVVDALGDTTKTVTSTISTTTEAASQGMTAASTTAATAISTVEKASVILAVISAALQVATAIANLFNNDDKKQKEIENLQQRIDQLQWELDNADAVRLQEKYGDAVERVRDLWLEAYNEVANLNAATMRSNNWFVRSISRMQHQNDILAKSVEKIADAYAKVSYSADKALGGQKYEEARAQLENLAEQQILIQQQIDKEEDKKKTDHSKIADWENTIRENAEKMASIINDLMEDIIGNSAEDLAQELGDAFFEAAAQGEDAMDAWHDKVKDIISDITKRMMIQKLLEQPIGQIFDKYKTRWFGDDGRFKGIDNVINSMNDLSTDLNNVGEAFNDIYQQLPDTVKDMLEYDAERTGESKGIATASQDSVDENNARLTTIQGHTYSLVQGMDSLNQKGNSILERLVSIDRSTSSSDERLSRMESRLRNIGSTVDDIYTKGINLRT